MKIFFMAAMQGKKLYDEYYQKIYRTIEEAGHKNLNDFIFSQSAEEFYTNLDEEGRKSHEEYYSKIIASLKAADINIFECSFPSLGVGYEVTKSIELNKPTVVLYLDDNVPHFFLGNTDEKLILKSYNSKNIKKVVLEAIEEAKQRSDKRFNFFISPHLLGYLEKTSKDLGVTKSTFIRSLILEHMRKSNSI
jgi:hypothetical protein